jgi:glycosyltransferase involved in cell wall biosynthesis
MPRVTVIIPTYNYAEVLPYSIGSVLRQKFEDFELLVIGDHCTDNSESVVQAINDPRIRWINLEKSVGHQSGPNNEGLKQGRGELAAYLGHDDLWLPNHLQQLVKTIDGGADVSYGITESVQPGGAAPVFVPEGLDYAPGMWIPPTGVMHRREAAIRVGGWRHFCDIKENMDPEADLWLRLHRAGNKIQLTRMLTAVKFSAAKRKGVYATRPTHEQAEWTKRIKNEPDFAAMELARMLSPRADYRLPFRQSVRKFFAETADRARRRLWRFGFGTPENLKQTRAEFYSERLKLKGVDDRH